MRGLKTVNIFLTFLFTFRNCKEKMIKHSSLMFKMYKCQFDYNIAFDREALRDLETPFQA